MPSSSTPLRQPAGPSEDEDLAALVREGLDEADRGEFADDEELARDVEEMLAALERRAAHRP